LPHRHRFPLSARRKFRSLADALDRRDLAVLRVEGEEHAGVHRQSIQQHRAGAALPEVAGLLCSRQPEIFSKREEERALVRDADGTLLSVDPQLDVGIGLFATVTGSRDREFRLAAQQSQLVVRAGKRGCSNDDASTCSNERAARWIVWVGGAFQP
jgi:hypothetical protein